MTKKTNKNLGDKFTLLKVRKPMFHIFYTFGTMKKGIQLIFAFVILQFLVSCSGPNKKNIIATNFDDLKAWNLANDAFTEKAARSEKYSIFTGMDKEYSLTYEISLDKLKSKGYSKLNATIWAKPSTVTKDAQWVAAVNSSTGANYIWKSSFINSAKESDEKGWKKITIQLEFPANAPDGIVKIYAWSPSKEEVYLDDFELTFE